MWEAAFWGFVGGFALLVGAGLGLLWRTPPRVVGIVMAFGAGVLISAVAFELVEEAFDASGALPVVAGLVAGALTFYLGDLILDKRARSTASAPVDSRRAERPGRSCSVRCWTAFRSRWPSEHRCSGAAGSG